MHSTTAVAVATLADELIKNSGNRPKYIDIFSQWKTVVGEHFALIAAPYKVTTVKQNKILVLKAIKGHALEIQHESAKILDAVHNFLGTKIFSNIKVIQMDINESL